MILCIPSLVNRHYILDLRPGASLVEYLNDQGFDCLLLEWPTPSIADANLKAEDYATYLLEQLQLHWQEINRPLIALGYCLGGIFALALAQMFAQVKGLALLATPWDYGQYPLAKLTPAQIAMLDNWVESEPLFSAEALQMLLYLADPYRLYLRFKHFGAETRPEVIESFVALEHWANDSIPISRALARECLLDWPHHNTVARCQWQVGSEKIDPRTLTIPALVAVPPRDHIVPTAVAAPLATLLPNATALRPAAGHVGMIAGMRRRELWKPLGEWLTRNFA